MTCSRHPFFIASESVTPSVLLHRGPRVLRDGAIVGNIKVGPSQHSIHTLKWLLPDVEPQRKECVILWIHPEAPRLDDHREDHEVRQRCADPVVGGGSDVLVICQMSREELPN